MICPRCQKDLAVVFTQRAAEWETRDLRCRACGYRSTSLTRLLDRRQDNPLGTTARTLLKWAKGGMFAELKDRAASKLSRVKKPPTEGTT